MGIDYYGALSLKRTCTDLEIKKAYVPPIIYYNTRFTIHFLITSIFEAIKQTSGVIVGTF